MSNKTPFPRNGSTAKRPGRKMDTTPNKSWPDQKIGLEPNANGEFQYLRKWNDENGVRRQEVIWRSPSAHTGRTVSSEPNKVFTPKSRAYNGDQVLTVPMNGPDGERVEVFVTLSVSTKGNLKATMSDTNPIPEPEETAEVTAEVTAEEIAEEQGEPVEA